MRRKPVVIVIVLVCVLSLSAYFVLSQRHQESQPEQENVSISNENMAIEDDTNNLMPQSTSVTETIDDSDETNEVPEQENGGEQDDGLPSYDEGGPRRYDTSSSAAKAEMSATDDYMRGQDANALGNNATNLIRTLFTFDSTSLSNGSWLTSVMNYVDYDGMIKHTDNNILYNRCKDSTWSSAYGKEPKFYASVEDASVSSVYGSTDVTTGKIHPVASVDVTYDVTDDLPGANPWWDRVTKRQATFLVHFNDNQQAVWVSKLTDKYISEVRPSSYREDH